MIRVDVPGMGILSFHFLVLDLNGTLTLDGDLIPGVRERLETLAGNLDIHILTADSLGRAAEIGRDLPVTLKNIPEKDQVEEKRSYVRHLPRRCVAVGNGRNDTGMLADAALGIAVLGPEGVFARAVHAADVCVRDINDALDLLINTDRLKATLRS